MTPSDPFSALARVYQALIRAAASAGALGADEGDLAWAMAPIRLPFVNRVMRPRLAERDVDARIVAVLHRYREAGSTCTWWLDPEATPADLGARLVAHGLVDEESAHAMDLDLARLPPVDLPDGATIRTVADAEALLVSQHVAAASIGGPPDVGDGFAAYRAPAVLGDAAPGRVVVAWLGPRPVATALAVVDGPDAGLYTVTTLPDVRGRGLGRAVSLAALHDARSRGATRGVLESSDEGHGVYRRIGFRDLGPMRVFSFAGRAWEVAGA